MITRVLSTMQYINLVNLKTSQNPSVTTAKFALSRFNAIMTYEPITTWPGYNVTLRFVSEEDLTWFYLHV